MVGTWKRTLKKDAILVTFNPFAPLGEEGYAAVVKAAHRHGSFLGLPVLIGTLLRHEIRKPIHESTRKNTKRSEPSTNGITNTRIVWGWSAGSGYGRLIERRATLPQRRHAAIDNSG